MPLFTGSGVALATPMNGGAIDWEGFGRLVDYQLENGTEALVVCGTTGEPSTLSEDEWAQAIRFVVERTAKRVPVIAGAGSNHTAHAVELCRRAEGMGVDGLLVVTPYYNKTTQGGLVAHFKAVAEAVHTPVIVYNVPVRTGLNMKAETVAALAGVPHIDGVKEASGDMAQVADIARLCGGKLAIYSGADDVNLPILALGGAGVVSVTGNVAPRLCRDMTDRWFAGDTAGARRAFLELMPLNTALFVETSPMPLKAALQMLGICTDEVRLPLLPAADATRAKLREAMAELGLV